MNEADLARLRSWFAEYCRSFDSLDEEGSGCLLLKEEHTHRVCANAIRIGVEEGFSGDGLCLAEAAALLHDVGRFEQYRQYRTFRDADSVDHGALGVEILLDSDILAGLDSLDRRTILSVVERHNAFRSPGKAAGRALPFLRLVRDADKLDIWGIFLEYYGQPAAERSPVIGLGFPDLPRCSFRVCEKIGQGGPVRLSSARCLNDFKLVQLSWVFDLCFGASFRMLIERGYIDAFAATLPRDRDVTGALDAIRRFVDRKVAGDLDPLPAEAGLV